MRGLVQGEPLMAAEGVSKSFWRGPPWRRTRVEVLRGASLTIGAGEMVGLVGENGSGKSVLIQIVVGLLAPDAGTVVRPKSLGYCPQEPVLWDKLTVGEHFDLFGDAYGLAAPQAGASARRLMEELGFDRYVDYRVENLSGGTRQKLNLSLALLHDPEVLLLDEPYSGFDWDTYTRFWVMAEERRAAGTGLLIVSHLLPERARLGRVVALRDGVIE